MKLPEDIAADFKAWHAATAQDKAERTLRLYNKLAEIDLVPLIFSARNLGYEVLSTALDEVSAARVELLREIQDKVKEHKGE